VGIAAILIVAEVFGAAFRPAGPLAYFSASAPLARTSLRPVLPPRHCDNDLLRAPRHAHRAVSRQRLIQLRAPRHRLLSTIDVTVRQRILLAQRLAIKKTLACRITFICESAPISQRACGPCVDRWDPDKRPDSRLRRISPLAHATRQPEAKPAVTRSQLGTRLQQRRSGLLGSRRPPSVDTTEACPSGRPCGSGFSRFQSKHTSPDEKPAHDVRVSIARRSRLDLHPLTPAQRASSTSVSVFAPGGARRFR